MLSVWKWCTDDDPVKYGPTANADTCVTDIGISNSNSGELNEFAMLIFHVKLKNSCPLFCKAHQCHGNSSCDAKWQISNIEAWPVVVWIHEYVIAAREAFWFNCGGSGNPRKLCRWRRRKYDVSLSQFQAPTHFEWCRGAKRGVHYYSMLSKFWSIKWTYSALSCHKIESRNYFNCRDYLHCDFVPNISRTSSFLVRTYVWNWSTYENHTILL